MAITFVRKSGAPAQTVDRTSRSLNLLSVKDAAAYAKVSTQTLRRLIKAGDLKIYRVGRQIRIDESDLIANITPKELKW
jgi:excisionase family DNA binding protein